jgi:hypothetical protein
MHSGPHQPREKTADSNFAALQYGEAFPDNSEISFVEVAERSR